MLDALAPPGVDSVQMTVATLYDRGVGILRNGAVFKRYVVMPRQSVVGNQDGKRCACALFLRGFDGPVVANQRVSTVGERHGVESAVVIGHVDEL